MYSDQAAFPKDNEFVTAAAAATTEIYATGTGRKKVTHVIIAADAALAASAAMLITLQSLDGSRVYGVASLSTQQTTVVLPGFEVDEGGLEAVNNHATVAASVALFSLRP